MPTSLIAAGAGAWVAGAIGTATTLATIGGAIAGAATAMAITAFGERRPPQ